MDLKLPFLQNTLLNSWYWENKCLRLQLKSSLLVLFENLYKVDTSSFQHLINRVPLLNYRYRGFFPLAMFQILTVALLPLKIRNPAKCIEKEHWSMIANSRQILYFSDSLGREKYSFRKQHYKQFIPEILQSHPCNCGLDTTYATLHLFIFWQQGNTGVHDVNVLSFISFNM